MTTGAGREADRLAQRVAQKPRLAVGLRSRPGRAHPAEFGDEYRTGGLTLLAMGVTPATALGAVRKSLGRATTDTDISTAATILVTAHGLATAS